MAETNKQEDYSIEVINFSAHLPIDIKPVIGRKWVLNGEENSNYKMIKDAYDDSATNAAIINAYINYIYADGLINTSESDPKKRKTSVIKHLSKADTKLIVQDFKTYGGYAIQIIWNSAEKVEDKKPLLIKYIPIFKLGLNINADMEVDGYWYSFDWTEKTKYKPKFYPKYTGKYVPETTVGGKVIPAQDVELLIVQRASSNPFFAQPDYISGIRYAQLEGELSNSAFNHVINGFQGTKVVNCNNGIPPTEELKAKYKNKILKNLTGTNNTNKVIVSFNASKEKGIEVTDIPIPELNQQYVHFAEEAEKKLIVAHSAPPILFSGTREGGGLGNNALELETATKSLYRKTIDPMREDILDGLMGVFKDIDASIELDFLDFEEFVSEKAEVVINNNIK